jgi:hypothetical protein
MVLDSTVPTADGAFTCQRAVRREGGGTITTPEVPQRPDVDAARRRPIFLTVLIAAIVAIIAVVLLSTYVFGGSCSDDDLRLAQQIPHYGGAELAFFDDSEGVGCAAQLEVEASPDEVLDHYRDVLGDDGWEVSVRDTMGEGPEGETAADLVARRGRSTVTIALETFEGQVSAAIRVDA